MKIKYQQILIPVASAIAGGLIVVGLMKWGPWPEAKVVQASPLPLFDQAFERDFFEQHDRMKKQLQQVFAMPGFDSSFTSDTYDISEREDENSVYFEIKVPDLKSTAINTTVTDGYVTITGTSENKDGDEFAQNISRSTFNRTFPLPSNVDGENFQMQTENEKVILKFPKKET